jgi:hypothetical protein
MGMWDGIRWVERRGRGVKDWAGWVLFVYRKFGMVGMKKRFMIAP